MGEMADCDRADLHSRNTLFLSATCHIGRRGKRACDESVVYRGSINMLSLSPSSSSSTVCMIENRDPKIIRISDS